MIFTLDEDQEQLRKVVRDFLAAESTEADVRRLMDSADGFDPGVWAQLGTELGLAGLAVPERFGGAGCTFREVGIVLEELGRTLACVPYFSSVVLAQTALLAADDDACARRWLPDLATGRRTGTVAWLPATGADPRAQVAAAADGDRWRLTGSRSYVVDGCTADVVLVVAAAGAGPSLFAVEAGADGMLRTPLPTMDLTRKLARIDLEDTPAEMVGVAGAGHQVLSRVLDIAAVGLAAEQVGGAARVLEMAVDHAKTRTQFGRPIGSFQAVKHRCADMLVEVELARSLAYSGLIAASENPEDLPVAASLAGSYCPRAYYRAAAANIQIHGGVGFTWEHPAHLYFKRAKSSELLLGGPATHRAELARRLGIGSAAVSA